MDNCDEDRKPSVAEKQAIDAAVAAAAASSTSDGDDDIRCHYRVHKKVKPALKKKNNAVKKPKKALQWDEVTIEEHDQYRGTRMKIEEPNTPYTYYESGTESDDSRARPKSPVDTNKNTLSWDTLQNRLDSVAAVREAFPQNETPSGGETSGSDNEEKRREEMRQLEFKEHRKRHYNEMELVRRFRKEHGSIIDDGDDADIEDGDD